MRRRESSDHLGDDATKGRMSRRSFLKSACGFAAAILAVNKSTRTEFFGPQEAEADEPTVTGGLKMTTVTLGTGEFTYEVAGGWGKLPEGWSFREVAGVAVDSKDHVYVLTRGVHPVIVFDREGNFLRSWGEGLFSNRPHGICISPDDFVYCVDDGDHTIRKFTTEGKLLWTLGTKGQSAQKWSGQPFNHPTHVAISPKTGEIYVSDGYGNARIHRFSADGRRLLSWGEPGPDPG